MLFLQKLHQDAKAGRNKWDSGKDHRSCHCKSNVRGWHHKGKGDVRTCTAGILPGMRKVVDRRDKRKPCRSGKPTGRDGMRHKRELVFSVWCFAVTTPQNGLVRMQCFHVPNPLYLSGLGKSIGKTADGAKNSPDLFVHLPGCTAAQEGCDFLEKSAAVRLCIPYLLTGLCGK